VNALSLTADGTTVFAGMDSGSIHVIECDSGRVEAPMRTERTGCTEVNCLALVEFNSNSKNSGDGVSGRLFAGHSKRIIAEWDLESRSCITVYGDARSGWGRVWSITARIVSAAGGHGVQSGGRRRRGPRGGECVIEFATGYKDGTVRVWRADDGVENGGEEKTVLNADRLVPEDPAAGCTSLPKRHVDTHGIYGNMPVCISASADGRWLVSGSFEGIVCVWDVVSGRCVATLLGYKAVITCVDISDCGSIVASCSDDTTTRMWRLNDSVWSRPIMLEHDEESVRIALTTDGSRAVTGDVGGVVRVWDTKTGMLFEPILRGHVNMVSTLSAEFTPARSNDIGWRGCDECLDVGARSWERPGSRSPRTHCFASSDFNDTFLLWNWPCEHPMKSSSDIPIEEPLRQVFGGELDVNETFRWREQRSWQYNGTRNAFAMRSSKQIHWVARFFIRGRS
jgi:WD40 repeat protein